ncbi:MAG TPA: pseudouridine synthase [Solirubrobacteraceae bacterium]|nr:pseudouridine synthase [Solirubrobacteraceae bacterium]
MRLGKHLAHAGIASRRASEALVTEGRVTVDGAVITDPARDVTGEEAIAVDGELVRGPGARVVYALHKPAGVVSTAADTHGRPTVVDLVPTGQRLYPVGRLDAESTGLILLTNDGDLAYTLTHPRFEVPRTYRARVNGRPSERALRALREGVVLDDGPTAPAQVRMVSAHEIELTIHEGRKHQVRRMCEAVGHRVIDLRRVAFGPLRLGDLTTGRHRRLTAAEVQRLRDSAREPQRRA